MPRKPHFTVDQVRAALEATGGIYSHAAVWLEQKSGRKCCRNTVKGYVERHPSLQQTCTDAREILVDRAEHGLAKAVKAGNMTAIIWTLKCLGKDRGWVERVEQTGKDGEPLIPGVIVIPSEETDLAAWAARFKPAESKSTG